MARGLKLASNSTALSTCGGSAKDLGSTPFLATRVAWIETPDGDIAQSSDSGTGSKSGVNTPIRASDPLPSGCHLPPLATDLEAGQAAKAPLAPRPANAMKRLRFICLFFLTKWDLSQYCEFCDLTRTRSATAFCAAELESMVG